MAAHPRCPIVKGERGMRAFVLVVLLSGCNPLFPKIPDLPEVDWKQDAGPVAAAGAPGPTTVIVLEVCRKACKNLYRLGCAGRMGSPGYDEVFGTGDEIPCEVVCSDIERASEGAKGLS